MLLEADVTSPLMQRLHDDCKRAADTLQEHYDNLKRMGYPGLE